jgi:hypothetical protein
MPSQLPRKRDSLADQAQFSIASESIFWQKIGMIPLFTGSSLQSNQIRLHYFARYGDMAE